MDRSESWEQFLLGTDPQLRFGRSILRHIPSSPRCKLCLAPFAGIGRPLMRLIDKSPWDRNPRVCRYCAKWLHKKGPGGADVPAALVFADVRGSTALAERMTPQAYAELIGRFFERASYHYVQRGGIIDQLVGDEAIGLFLPAYAGPDYVNMAVEAATTILRVTGHAEDPWITIGVGVHVGQTFIGSVGAGESFTDFTAIGDTVNTAARLASAARTGEVLLSRDVFERVVGRNLDLESRSIEMKGKSLPLESFVIEPDSYSSVLSSGT